MPFFLSVPSLIPFPKPAVESPPLLQSRASQASIPFPPHLPTIPVPQEVFPTIPTHNNAIVPTVRLTAGQKAPALLSLWFYDWPACQPAHLGRVVSSLRIGSTLTIRILKSQTCFVGRNLANHLIPPPYSKMRMWGLRQGKCQVHGYSYIEPAPEASLLTTSPCSVVEPST